MKRIQDGGKPCFKMWCIIRRKYCFLIKHMRQKIGRSEFRNRLLICYIQFPVEYPFKIRAVTHQRISETRAGRVEKIAKFLTRQTHVGNTFKTRYKRVGYAWCTSGARRCTSLKVSARFARVWAKKNLNMLKNFLKARRVPGV